MKSIRLFQLFAVVLSSITFMAGGVANASEVSNARFVRVTNSCRILMCTIKLSSAETQRLNDSLSSLPRPTATDIKVALGPVCQPLRGINREACLESAAIATGLKDMLSRAVRRNGCIHILWSKLPRSPYYKANQIRELSGAGNCV